jgi:hypothetical protein
MRRCDSAVGLRSISSVPGGLSLTLRSGDGLAIVTAIRELASFEFEIFLALRLGGGVTFKTFSSRG